MFGLKLDTRKLKQPCFGIFLPGSVKNTAIANAFVAVANMIIFGAGIIEYLERTGWSDSSWLKRYVRPVFWLAYYCYWGSEIYLTFILYSATKRREYGKCLTWMKVQIGCFLIFLLLYCFHCLWLSDFNLILVVLFGVLSFYKLYTFWVVYSFMGSVKRESYAMNRVLAELKDEDVEEFQHGNASRRKRSSQPVQKPYDRSVEINMEYLNDSSYWILLSKNDNSSVYQAEYTEPGSPTKVVAVKTIRAEPSFFKTQLCEFKIRTEIGDHEHVVKLIGANTSNIKKLELDLIMEYCLYGNLESFLENKQHLGLFSNQLDNFGRLRPSRIQGVNSRLNRTLPIMNALEFVRTVDLVKWSLQIAKGMTYLHENNVIHGDLAARNILVTNDQIAKISDFGLAKQIYSYNGYTTSKERRLPWRSLAPECFGKKLIFSYESDVWAFGTTLWEIFNLGLTPYSHLDRPDERFVYNLKQGTTPACGSGRPTFSPVKIYEIMQSCWNLNPQERPTFKDIVAQLEEYMESILSDDPPRKGSDYDSGHDSSGHIAIDMSGVQSHVVPTHMPRPAVRCNPYQDRLDNFYSGG